MPRSGEHTLYYSDKFCIANSKDIVHTILTNSAVPIPRTLYILLWQIPQCQSQGHTVYYSCIPRTLCLRKFSSANHKGLCAYVSDKFSNANPKDIVLTQTLQCQSQGHCVHTALTNSGANPRDFVHTNLTMSAVPILRTLCLRKFSSANPKDTVQTTQTNSPVPNPRKL